MNAGKVLFKTLLLNLMLLVSSLYKRESVASSLTTYAGKKVTIGAGHFQIIDFFYDW